MGTCCNISRDVNNLQNETLPNDCETGLGQQESELDLSKQQLILKEKIGLNHFECLKVLGN
jgi:hypothetical protein